VVGARNRFADVVAADIDAGVAGAVVVVAVAVDIVGGGGCGIETGVVVAAAGVDGSIVAVGCVHDGCTAWIAVGDIVVNAAVGTVVVVGGDVDVEVARVGVVIGVVADKNRLRRHQTHPRPGFHHCCP